MCYLLKAHVYEWNDTTPLIQTLSWKYGTLQPLLQNDKGPLSVVVKF